MATDTTPIPAFYRVVFRLIDPFFCGLGVATHLLTKDNVLAGLTRAPTTLPNTETEILLNFLAGCFAMLGVFQVGLLYTRPKDVGVWRVLQLGTLVFDIIQASAIVRVLLVEGRLADTSTWLPGEWQNFVGNAVIGAIRLAFVLGVGLKENGSVAKAKTS